MQGGVVVAPGVEDAVASLGDITGLVGAGGDGDYSGVGGGIFCDDDALSALE